VPPTLSVNVFYVTNRRPANQHTIEFDNAPDPNGQLHYGVCNAGIEELSTADPVSVDKGFVKQLIPSSRDELFTSLSNTQNSNALLFIHGYKNSLDDACATAAQMAHDMRFTGIVMIYSWPSFNRYTKYYRDGQTVRGSTPHLKDFVTSLSSKVNLHLQVLAHSMGNRALVAVITDRVEPTIRSGFLANVVFAAPDLDRSDFTRQLAKGTAAHRLTLYASNHDSALLLSGLFHLVGRAGDSNPDVLILPNLESIDTSAVDTSLTGHTYYSDSWSVLSDLHSLLQNDTPAALRYGLLRTPNGAYWILEP
jgi:esterase/lipase superfamily enzyme